MRHAAHKQSGKGTGVGNGPGPRRRLLRRRSAGHNSSGSDADGRLAELVRMGVSIDEVEDERCRRHLAPMVRRVFKTLNPGTLYKHNWHIDLICEYLEAMYLGELRYLIINIAPRSLKSIIASIAFPAWLLGKDPSEHILCASYVDRLAIDLSVKCRRVMQSDWYQRMFPETQFAADQNEKSKYETTRFGYRTSTSVGGSPTGYGGHYKIADDPIDPDGAFSDKERHTTTDWFQNTWPHRTDDAPTARELIIMQRLHVDDPTGLLLQDGRYELLKIPTEAPKRQVITFPLSKRQVVREPGDLMHPERIGPEEVAALKKHTYSWNGQHQQEPIPLEGGRIKLDWFPRYGALPKDPSEIVISVDTAGKGKDVSNPTAFLVFMRKGETWYLARSLKDKWAYPSVKRQCYSLDATYSMDALLIEDKAMGQSLVEDLREESSLPVVAIEPEADKVSRMESQLAQIEAGVVSLPDPAVVNAPWLLDIETFLSSYPNPSEWDELDALSQFLKWLRRREKKKLPTGVPMGITSASAWKV